IPKNVQVATAPMFSGAPQRPKRYLPRMVASAEEIAEAIELIERAERPVLYTGGGVINSGPRASELLREFQKLTGAPLTSTLMGLGAFPADHPDWLGMLGMHGTYEANMAMNQCDVMVCIGARFDDRVTGRLDAFSPGSKKIHIDIDRASINKVIPVDLGIVGDCATVLEQLIEAWGSRKPLELAEWKARIAGWRARDSLAYPKRKDGAIMPQLAVERLFALTREHDPIITTEVGQHRARDAGRRHAGGDRRAARQSRAAGDRYRGRGLDPDEHPGDGHREPVPPADQGVHPQQRVHGHGPPVAGADLREPLFELVL